MIFFFLISSLKADISGKLLFGYQGWFGAPGDGSDWNYWKHWSFQNVPPDCNSLTFDFHPDLSEFDSDELFETEIPTNNGGKLNLYSAYKYKTVRRHFEWMQVGIMYESPLIICYDFS